MKTKNLIKPDVGRALLSDFPSHTYDEWRKAAEELLKGKPFEKVLLTPTYEGFELQPVYMAEHIARLTHQGTLPGAGNRVRSAQPDGYLDSAWKISQELVAPVAKCMNQLIHEGLSGGQNELNIWLDMPTRDGSDPDGPGSQSIGRCGMSVAHSKDIADSLEGVHLDMISVFWRSGNASNALAGLYLAEARRRGLAFSALSGAIECDPIGSLVAQGWLGFPLEKAYDDMASLTQFAIDEAPGLQTITVAGHSYHDAGGSSCQEMACVLSTALAYLKAMAERGIALKDAVAHMRLCLSVGPNFFIEIAKLRAMRLVWSRLLEALEVDEADRKVHLHARTGLWNKTVYDPYVNMLRTTTEAFAAVVGGADSLHIGPFDEVVREPDVFSRRIARNQHAVLAEECNLTQVIDPAGGSWAVEALTDKMAEQAWKAFQDIEAEGGMFAALSRGLLQAQIETSRKEKAKNIQRRKDVIVGINNYPIAGEKRLAASQIDYGAIAQERVTEMQNFWRGQDTVAVDRALNAIQSEPARSASRIALAMAAADAGASLGQIHAALLGEVDGGEQVEPVRLHRAAEDYENLRQLAEKIEERSGHAPEILQLNIGPSRRYRARADWTSAFFQVGGLQVSSNQEFADIAAAVEALRSSAVRVAIITSDDETYLSVAEPLAKAIKAERPEVHLLLAGAPGENEAAWRAAGIDDFVNVRVNAYEMNRALLARLEK